MTQRYAVAGGRRKLLKVMGTAPLSAVALSLAHHQNVQAQTVKTKVHIVIVGSGLGGIAVASRLRAMLDGAKITIIDKKEEHNYQPGYTLVATGIWPVEKVWDRNADFQPSGVEWIKDMVVNFDPDGNKVTTSSGQVVSYDFLVVATGLHLDYGQIEGMDVNAIGHNGMGSVYHGPEAAVATWQALDAYRQKGGRAIMTLPSGSLKCAGAPLKVTFMVADRLRQSGTLQQSRIDFFTGLPDDTVFGVKAVNDNVLQRWRNLGIQPHYLRKLVGVDLGSRTATFASLEGEKTRETYDFLHVVPPMRAPDAVKNSPLSWKDGPMAPGGWLAVDKATLQHTRFPNVFGIGDINGTPRGKTAATIKKSAPIVAHNLTRVIQGQPADMGFDGYTSCPMIVREGSAMLIEFDYDGKLTPSLPMIEPLQESFMAWFMKYRLLKPAYISVLKGRV